ncbi:SUKH-3 domain-containing protein [Amycolatopsis sp. NPDC051071]|uniref:SUKH-3 domain-containing protein n=1 Tax=Amycolatopsis sp. NPDC051071 TaxID=3154637 RepID=UPI003416970C
MSALDGLSPGVERLLEGSGWSRDRRVSIGAWDAILRGEGYRLSPCAEEILRGLGGLRVRPVGTGPYTHDLLFEPELAGSGAYDIAEQFEEQFGQRFYPIAEWISNACVFLGDAGKVVSYDDIERLDIADTFADALDIILLGVREPRVID